MTPRVPPVTDPDEEQRALLAKTLLAPDGSALNVFATLARRPQLLKRMNALGGYFFVASGVEPRERELVILRTAALIGCEYEIAQHRRVGAEAGLSDAEIEAAVDATRAHEWTRDDRALLTFCEELLRTDTVTDRAWDALASRYDDLERMELLILVGYYRMLGGFLNGIGVEVEREVEC